MGVMVSIERILSSGRNAFFLNSLNSFFFFFIFYKTIKSIKKLSESILNPVSFYL